jgi:hypothetical protein
VLHGWAGWRRGRAMQFCLVGMSLLSRVQGRSVLITIAELLLISICYGYGPYASAGLIAAK